jgi:hypothetical protein
VRVKELRFSASGVSPSASLSEADNGIWPIPQATTGRIDLQAAGKVFSPASLELTKDAPMVFVVEVADQIAQSGGSGRERHRFEDDAGAAYAYRRIRLLYAGGREEIVVTDENGYFWAEPGCQASAEEDAAGLAVAMIAL